MGILQQDFPLQIPAKIYEYIASGRPLIMIGGEGATSDLVTGNGLGLVCRDDVASLKQMLLAVANETVTAAPGDTAARREFGYRALTGQLADVLNAAIGAASASSEHH